jgi:DNA-binding NtrC family response regulator
MNAIEHALVFSPDLDRELDVCDLPEALRAPVAACGEAIPSESSGKQAIPTLEAAERRLIEAALRASDGNQTRAAQVLAIERHRLRRRIVHHGLTDLLRNQP